MHTSLALQRNSKSFFTSMTGDRARELLSRHIRGLGVAIPGTQKLDKLMRGTTTADKELAARVIVAGKML
jgi:hypothetical protein